MNERQREREREILKETDERTEETEKEWKRERQRKSVRERRGYNHDERRKSDNHPTFHLQPWKLIGWATSGPTPFSVPLATRGMMGKIYSPMRAKRVWTRKQCCCSLITANSVSHFLNTRSGPKMGLDCYSHVTGVLICFNEPQSQSESLHVLILGSRMTGALVCCNEHCSQGERLHLLSLGPLMTSGLIRFNEPGRWYALVRISTWEEQSCLMINHTHRKLRDCSFWAPTCPSTIPLNTPCLQVLLLFF